MRHSVIAAVGLAAASALGVTTIAGAGGSASMGEVTCSETATPKIHGGKPSRLTGIWKDPSGNTFYVRQLGSCMWLLGQSRRAAGEPQGIAFTSVMYGRIRPNLTIAARWSDVPRQSTAMGHGSASAKILRDGGRVTLDFGGLVLSMKKACTTNTVC